MYFNRSNCFSTLYFLLLFIGSEVSFAQNKIEKNSKQQDIKLNEIKEYFKLYEKHKNSEPDSALYYLKEGLGIADSNFSTSSIRLEGYNLLAGYWFERGQYDSTIVSAEQALKIETGIKDSLKIWTYNNYGKGQLMQSNYLESINSFLDGLELANEFENFERIQTLTNNIGNVYLTMNNVEKAESYYLKALQIGEEKGLYQGLALTYNNMGLICRLKNDDTKAMEYFEKALILGRKSGHKAHISIFLQSLGNLYTDQQRYSKAYTAFLESYEINNLLKDKAGKIKSLISLAYLAHKMGENDRALKYLTESRELTKELQYKLGFQELFYVYAEVYSSMGDYKKAYSYRLKYESWKDSVSDTRHFNEVNDIMAQYDIKEKENKILSLKNDQLAIDAKLQSKNAIIKMLSIGFLAVISILLTSYFIYKERTKNKTQRELINSIDKDRVDQRIKIAQYLHDNIGSLLVLTKSQIALLKEKQNSDVWKKPIEIIDKAITEVRQISHDLMPSELIKFGLTSAIQTNLLDSIDEKTLTTNLYAYNLDNRLEIAVEVQLYRICQELVQNTLKHANAKHLNIYINRYKKHMSLMVEDDGIGFHKESVQDEKMGFKNISSRINYLNGELKIDTNKNSGTTVSIKVPI